MDAMALAPAADVDISPQLVEQLLADQIPALADLPLTRLAPGWDNEVFRLGETLVVRLPRRASASGLIENEARWLPEIAQLVGLPVPQPVFTGRPSDAYPRPWTVTRWVDGRPASAVPVADRTAFAPQLADVVWALHAPAPTDAPLNPVRGGSLVREPFEGRILARIAASSQPDELSARWQAWRSAPDHDGVDVWLHGDLHPHNMIVGEDGLLSSVIDWGDLTAGDPACDLATAWLTFDAAGRRAFRDQLDAGHPRPAATWTRAKAWALHLGLILTQMTDDAPWLTAVGEHALAALLAEPA